METFKFPLNFHVHCQKTFISTFHANIFKTIKMAMGLFPNLHKYHSTFLLVCVRLLLFCQQKWNERNTETQKARAKRKLNKTSLLPQQGMRWQMFAESSQRHDNGVLQKNWWDIGMHTKKDCPRTNMKFSPNFRLSKMIFVGKPKPMTQMIINCTTKQRERNDMTFVNFIINYSVFGCHNGVQAIVSYHLAPGIVVLAFVNRSH